MRVDPRAVNELLDVELGERYRDDATGFTGTCVGMWIKYGGIVEVQLSRLQDGKPIEHWFGGDRVVRETGAAEVGFRG